MKGPQNCKHKECGKRSMMRVFTKFHSREHQLTSEGQPTEKKWPLSTEATLLYICSNCAWATDFYTWGWPDPKFILSEPVSSFAIWLVPDRLVHKIKTMKGITFQMLKRMHDDKRKEHSCIGCGQWVWIKCDMQKTESGYTPIIIKQLGAEEPIAYRLRYWPTIIKLYAKGRRKYVGYYCRHCKVAYMLNLYSGWEKSATSTYGDYKIIPYSPLAYASTGKRYSPFAKMNQRARKV